MHFTLHFNGLDDFESVSLEPAIEIVQLDAAYPARSGVVKPRGNGLAEGVVAFFLPPAYEVKSVLDDFAFQFQNFLGRVLQISIHGNDNATFCRFETELKSSAFAVVTSHPNADHPSRIRLRQLRHNLP